MLSNEAGSKGDSLANVPEEFHYERDPDDEMYVNLAIVSNATYLSAAIRIFLT
jgi:predicted nucleic acid-binding protein